MTPTQAGIAGNVTEACLWPSCDCVVLPGERCPAALASQPAQPVQEPDWWIVLTDMGKVIFHGPDKARADRVASIHGRSPEPLYLHPAPSHEPVAIVPPYCSGSALSFDPGVLHVSKDGSGYIAINEDDFVLEDDRCEGEHGPGGSVHWITRMDASEIIALRNFLNGNAIAPSQEPVAVVKVEARKALEEAYIRGATWYRQNEDFGGLLRKAAQDYADYETSPDTLKAVLATALVNAQAGKVEADD